MDNVQTILAIVIPIIAGNAAVIGVVYRFSKEVGNVGERLARIEGRLGINPGNPGTKEEKDA